MNISCAPSKSPPASEIGRGHLAMTIDQGPDMSRYQGLVALDGGDLEHAAHEYFMRSEQIPTRIRDRPRSSRHDHRPGAGHEPLPGLGRARRRGPRARGA